jgi:hypothetical protein
MVVVLIGRADAPASADVSIRGFRGAAARRFLLDASAPGPHEVSAIAPNATGGYDVPIPARSVTTLILERASHR